MLPLPVLRQFLDFLTVPFLGLNFIDFAVVAVVLVYAFEGYSLGFIRSIVDFLTFLLSFAFGLSFYVFFGSFLSRTFHVPGGFANALGFFLAAFICEILLTLFFRFLILPSILKRVEKLKYSREAERYAGIVPGVLSAVVLLSFILTLIVTLPISPFLKNAVATSRFGEPLVSNIQGFDKRLNNVFGGAVNDALTFFTIEPKSEELLKLNFQATTVHIDEESEAEMFTLLNNERQKVGLKALGSNDALRDVGRAHCQDMLRRGYFSHYTPEGLSPFDRMNAANIDFDFAGENLALAPDVKLAMQGLMNSPGHRANILSENFGQVGIGVMDAGIYGKAFCQEFTN